MYRDAKQPPPSSRSLVGCVIACGDLRPHNVEREKWMWLECREWGHSSSDMWVIFDIALLHNK